LKDATGVYDLGAVYAVTSGHEGNAVLHFAGGQSLTTATAYADAVALRGDTTAEDDAEELA
jgi:hypothetical protein